MDGRCVVGGLSLWVALSGVCQAEPTATQGLIRFTGSIVEPGCRSSVSPGAALELDQCPRSGRGATLQVAQVAEQGAPAARHAGVSARLIADSGPGEPYYNQRYALVDDAGKPVLTGTYLITLTAP